MVDCHHEQRPLRVLVEVGHVDPRAVQQVLQQTEMRVEDELGHQADSGTRERGMLAFTVPGMDEFVLRQDGQEIN
jgi:hypothetical protein